jgi:hypothetical protein
VSVPTAQASWVVETAPEKISAGKDCEKTGVSIEIFDHGRLFQSLTLYVKVDRCQAALCSAENHQIHCNLYVLNGFPQAVWDSSAEEIGSIRG